MIYAVYTLSMMQYLSFQAGFTATIFTIMVTLYTMDPPISNSVLLRRCTYQFLSTVSVETNDFNAH